MNSGSYRKMTSFLIVKTGCCIVCQKENIHIGNKMNSNFKSIFFIEANVKAYMKILFSFMCFWFLRIQRQLERYFRSVYFFAQQ